MKTRKVISAILAGACAVSALGFSATAADTKDVTSTGDLTLKATAAGATVTINVTVPSKIATVINPYGVAITDKNAGAVDEFGVVSPVYEILNNSGTTAVSVSVAPYAVLTTKKVSGTGDEAVYDYSGVAWSDTDLAGTEEGKQINAFVIAYSDLNKEKTEADKDPFDPANKDSKGKFLYGKTSDAKNQGTIVPFTNCSKIEAGGKAADIPDGVELMVLNPATKQVTKAMLHKHTTACGEADEYGTCEFKGQDDIGLYAGTTKKENDYIGNAGKFQIRGTTSSSSAGWSSSDKATLNVVFSFGVCDTVTK